ncbi:unnamed protein product [Larinioides sclopetarius]|uniref:RNA-directed DNA polymerase n=1 Tax=Larinioides sclopetarius TaxID=280406 RepID=A0AAV2BF00_9ARAC
MEKHSSEKRLGAKKGGSKPWSSETPNSSDWRKREFERKRVITCYNCQKPGHISTNCTEPKKDLRFVNNLAMDPNFAPSFKPFLSQAKVNHVDTVVLRDTGSSIDLSPIHLINAEDFTGEKVWVKQPLDNEFRCLPLARILLESPEFGTVWTKAAIVGKSVNMGHYLLGNSTQELIDAYKNNPQSINAVVTRSQSKRAVKGVTDESNGSQKTEIESSEVAVETEVAGMINLNETNLEMDEEDEPIKLPPADACPLQKLVEVNAEEFLKAQKDCPNLKSLWEKVALGKTTEFGIERELLFRKSTDHHGFERKQLLIPAKYKFKVLSLCHEGFGCHMGTTKTKDKLLRYYFWPQCIKEAEEFVKTCDACERVGKSSERKKAPLKLTPVISEVFSKVNLDTVGPLPVSTKNNRYLLTCINLASKYPEAIPLETITSESITDALLLIFSRIGYPREVQLDNASSFTSKLTTTFFEKFGMKFMGYGWLTTYSWRCEPIDTSNNPVALKVIFVLRKKNNQINFLHVFHHTTVPITTWFGISYGPGGYNTLFLMANSFIHVWMYLYYGLAAFGPKIQKYLWWKRYLTSLQLLVRNGWLATYSWRCEPIDTSNNPVALKIIFVLRKKDSQLNFLHVFHHTTVPVTAWFGVSYGPGSVHTCVPVLYSPMPVCSEELQSYDISDYSVSWSSRLILRALLALLLELLYEAF